MTISFDQQSFPDAYEQGLVGPLFRPWVDLIFDEVGLAAGDRLLDIACGTGIVARVAKERVGEAGIVVGVDVSPAMLAVARRVGAGIDWREGDAAALPLRDDEQFDVAACQQGLQFFPDRPGAVQQMRRALAPGGRLAVSTWRPDEEAPFFRDLRHVAERHLGPIMDRRHSFGDAGPIESLLHDAGFREVRSKTLSRTIRFSDASVIVRLNTMALVGMSAAAKSLSDDERQRAAEAVARDSGDVVQRYRDGSGVAFELRTNLTTARS